jgi:nitrogen fixation NifU-like protein
VEVIWLYTQKVIDHFLTPQNIGNMADADSIGIAGDPSCGDHLKIFIKVNHGIIQDISFLVYGCTASVATSSMTTVLAKGKSLDEARKITQQDIIDALDGLPEQKQHCSNLGVSALRSAILNYQLQQTWI